MIKTMLITVAAISAATIANATDYGSPAPVPPTNCACDTHYCPHNPPAPAPGTDCACVYTQGYWKNHESAWPVSSLTLGTRTYTQAQLLEILRTPVKGNGLISLAHQLIAARLNLAQQGACAAPANVAAALTAANVLIGSAWIPPTLGSISSVPTSTVSGLVDILDAYNNGQAPGGPAHCDD